jgi:hypothetical protein
MKRAYFGALALAGVVHSGCTFYTACPTPAPAAAAGSNASGNGTGGSNGTGGGNGNGGTSITTGGNEPTGEWVNETFNLAALASECGNVSFLSAKPDEDMLIVGIAQRGLFSKASDAGEWTALGQGKGSAEIVNRTTGITYDPEHRQTFWENGIYNANGVYRTDDNGETFVDLPINHNDGLAIDFSDPDRLTMLTSGHEQSKILNKSQDGGKTWQSIGENLPEAANTCPHVMIIDAETYLLGCGTYGGGKGALYRTVDGGDSWDKVNDIASAAQPLLASDGTIYWAAEGDAGLVRSSDQGETWDGPFGAKELIGFTPAELPNGQLAMFGANRMVVSSDSGETWQAVSAQVPYAPSGFTYSATRKAFYVWHWTCAGPVPDDAIMAYDFDWEAAP